MRGLIADRGGADNNTVIAGYRLVFQDGAKVYLEYSVAKSIALADQLRRHARG